MNTVIAIDILYVIANKGHEMTEDSRYFIKLNLFQFIPSRYLH